MFEIVGGIIVLTIMIVLSGIKVVKDYDRLVVFRLGKVVGVRGTGVQLIVPIIERSQSVDTRIYTLPIATMEATTSDNFPIKVSALCMFQINDPIKAVTKVDNATKATGESAQASIRSVVGHHDFRHLMQDRRRLNGLFKSALEKRSRLWGVRVIAFEIKELKVPAATKKALSKLRRQKADDEHHTTLNMFHSHLQTVGRSD